MEGAVCGAHTQNTDPHSGSHTGTDTGSTRNKRGGGSVKVVKEGAQDGAQLAFTDLARASV